MADQNIKNVQTYLNSMYGLGLSVTGNTGSVLMEGLIKAFQIENRSLIASFAGTNDVVTGIAGPNTIKAMKSLHPIKLMDPSDKPNNNVSLVQCALFAKGYSAGGNTGIYYNNGQKAIKAMQGDAGLTVDGIINWKVLAGLFSYNWFVTGAASNSQVRAIQQQLNKDWSDQLGVGPTDGIKSRHTVQSLLGALQAAEGIVTETIFDMNQLNFGPNTIMNYPGYLSSSRNGGIYTKFNKVAQYALYFYGYNPGRFDGVYDATMTSKVKSFQDDMKLTGINEPSVNCVIRAGEIDVSTMMSLLTSKGDVDRPAKACDCATILNAQQARDLKNAGYTHVGRYLTGTVGNDFRPKNLSIAEIKNITAAGLKVFPIYQDGGYLLSYFKTPFQGITDAVTAIKAAEDLGIPKGATIYFAVDFDCYGDMIPLYIHPYFSSIRTVFGGTINDNKRYKVGVYGPREVCQYLYDKKMTIHSFVADMSTGFTGNLGFKMPENWTFDQFYEYKFASSPSFDLDKVAYSGRDVGIAMFDEVIEKTEEQISNALDILKLESERQRLIHETLDGYRLLDIATKHEFKYDNEYPLSYENVGGFEITSFVSVSTKVNTNTSPNKQTLDFSVDSKGNLNSGFTSNITSAAATLSTGGVNKNDIDDCVNKVKRVALSFKSGNVTTSYSIDEDYTIKLSFTVNSGDLLPANSKVNGKMSITFSVRIKVTPTVTVSVNWENVAVTVGALGFFGLCIYTGNVPAAVSSSIPIGEQFLKAFGF